jgi:hypothetical protein
MTYHGCVLIYAEGKGMFTVSYMNWAHSGKLIMILDPGKKFITV